MFKTSIDFIPNNICYKITHIYIHIVFEVLVQMQWLQKVYAEILIQIMQNKSSIS